MGRRLENQVGDRQSLKGHVSHGDGFGLYPKAIVSCERASSSGGM